MKSNKQSKGLLLQRYALLRSLTISTVASNTGVKIGPFAYITKPVLLTVSRFTFHKCNVDSIADHLACCHIPCPAGTDEVIILETKSRYWNCFALKSLICTLLARKSLLSDCLFRSFSAQRIKSRETIEKKKATTRQTASSCRCRSACVIAFICEHI